MEQNPEQGKTEPTMGPAETENKPEEQQNNPNPTGENVENAESAEANVPENHQDTSPQHDPHKEDVDNSDDIKAAPEVGEELSKVATSPKKNVFVFGMMALGFVFMAWKLLAPALSDDGPIPITDEAPLPQGASAEMPIEIEDTAPPIPQLPEPPQLVAPTPPPPPVVTEREQNTTDLPPLPNQAPPPPSPSALVPTQNAGLPTGVNLGGSDAEDAEARLQAKRKSPIHLFGGAAGGGASEAAAARANMTDAEKNQSSDFKKRGNLHFVLGKGKVIDAVIETAINSDHPEEVRAVITRDVHAESGKLVLIPKGTRIFGEFTTESATGYGRVAIKWNRIDLATGYTVTIDSPAVDALGRSGIQAVIDNKYKEQMANAFLSSAFSVAVAAGVDKLVPPVQSTQSAANVEQANNLQSTALSIFNDKTIASQDTKRENICSAVLNAFPDKTSASYTTFNQACMNARLATSGTPEERLNTIMTAVTSASTSLVSQTAEATTPSNKQKAADEAFKNLSSKMEEIVKQKELKPTITVDQGTPVKIFIKKDYLFPKDAVLRARVLR